MATKFTAKFVENVRPGPARRELPDSGCSGLYLIVQPSGHRSWAARYRFNGVPTKLTLGAWPAVSLLDARIAATTAREQVAKGKDPAKAKVDAKIATDAAKANTVTSICESYMALEGRKLRTVDQRASILQRLVYPALGSLPISEVKRIDIARLLDKIEIGSGARMADVTLGVLRRIFHWYELRHGEFVSPIIRGMGRQNVADHRRERTLNDDELRPLWAATGDGAVFSTLIRFLLLSGCRRNEASGMKWSEIDGDVWTLPPARSKTKVEVVRPLSKAALALLDSLPRFRDCDYVFVASGVRQIKSFSEPKARLVAASGVTDWRLHDLRRTARTLLSRSGVIEEVAERCLGHAKRGVVATYNRHRYLDEQRLAFEKLSALVKTIINPPEGDVADIEAERKRRRR